MSATPSPLKPPAGDVRRITRIRENIGTENMYNALFPLVATPSPAKRPPVRHTATALGTDLATAWRVRNSLPLEEISNMSFAGRRATLLAAVETPEKVVIPSILPHHHFYLNQVESEALVKLIDTRAHNNQGIGKTGIRQYAADLRAQRLLQPRVPLPSKSWYYEFKRLWLDDDFRPLRSKAKELKRAAAERKPEIEAWFRKLKGYYDEHDYPPHCIWAGDETGLDGDVDSKERIIVPKTLKVAEKLKGSFRDHVSAMHICNAAGVNLAPIFSFIGKLFHPDLLNGAPDGSKTAMQASGYFDHLHLKAFLVHMVEYMDSRPDMYRVDGDITKPRLRCLFILDGASTHVSGDALQYAMVHLIDVMFLPANLTHIMQVSDVGVFGPFKIAYRKAADEWRHVNRREMDKYDIAAIEATAWAAAMNEHNVISGFFNVGQWSFSPSMVLDMVLSFHPHASPPATVC